MTLRLYPLIALLFVGSVSNADSLFFTLPDWNDEMAAYAAQGLATGNANLDIVDQGATLTSFTGISNITNTHNDTEGDFLWTAYHQEKRLAGIRSGAAQIWEARRDNLIAFFINDYVSGQAWNFDRNSHNHDHLYGWGLADYFADSGDAAAATVLNDIVADVSSFFAGTTPGQIAVGSSDGSSGRRWARQLRFAARVAEVLPTAANRTWRDKVVDIVLQDPQWDSTYNAYWRRNVVDSPLDYAAGDRQQNTFHMGVMMDALFVAWRSLDAEGDSTRADMCRQRLVDLATFYRDVPLDGNGFLKLAMGYNINSGSFVSAAGTGSPNGVYTIPPINGLVMAYKFTGDQTYLDRAWTLFRNWQASPGLSPSVPANNVQHFVDSKADSSTGFRFTENNKGELQYVYALFENGGSPVVLSQVVRPQPPISLVVQ